MVGEKIISGILLSTNLDVMLDRREDALTGTSTVAKAGEDRRARGRGFFPTLASERLDIALCRVSSEVARAAEAWAKNRDMGVGEHLVLKMLSDAIGPCCQRELSDGLRIDRSVMVGCVDGLEEAGLVRRERSTRDRRAYAVFITEAGRAALLEAESEAPALLDEAFGALSADEREMLDELLGKLLAATPSA